MEARKWCDNSLDYLSVGIYVLNKTKEANFDAFNIIEKKKKKRKETNSRGLLHFHINVKVDCRWHQIPLVKYIEISKTLDELAESVVNTTL